MTKNTSELNRTARRFHGLRNLLPVFAVLVLAINGAVHVAAQQPAPAKPAAPAQQPAPAQGLLGATYKELLPEQKALVDDWFKRVSVAMKKTIPAEEGYDNMPLSYKTTFSAITHALIHTTLTDKDGKSLGASAIILIDKVDTVAGQIPGVGGDEQFRIYIELKPGALDILAKAKEFIAGRTTPFITMATRYAFEAPEALRRYRFHQRRTESEPILTWTIGRASFPPLCEWTPHGFELRR